MTASARLMALLALLLGLAACGGGGSEQVPAGPPVPASNRWLRIEVNESGIYRLAHEDLLAAGYTQGSLQADQLAMTTRGQPVALRVKSADNRSFGPGDYLDFYAEGLDNPFTGTAVYWLGQGGSSVARMASRSVAVSGTAAPLTVFQDTLHVEKNLTAWGLAPDAPAADYWYWEKLTAPQTGTYPFQLPELAEQAGPSSLTIRLQGGSTGGPDPDHRVRVELNGTQVGEINWYGKTELVRTFPVPRGLLRQGDNSLSISLPGDTGAAVDIVYLNHFEIRHWSPIQAQSDVAEFSVAGGTGQPIQAQGFTSAGIELFEISDPLRPILLTQPTLAPAGAGYSATFQDPSATARSYLALTPSRIRRPLSFSSWTSGALHDPSAGADYLLIAPRAFLPAAAPLLQLRKDQGLRATAVAVEDIFNEFSHGLPDPQAIKTFLGFAYQSWTRPAPAYVLLLGDATWDYRDRLGTGKLSQVPCHLSWTETLGLTPDDNWFVALNGTDLLPTMMLGRLPSATPAQAAALVQKLVGYESATTPPPQKALFVADNNDPSFSILCDELAGLLPASIAADKIYLGSYTDFSLCRQDVIAAFNRGMLIATYAGHGNKELWAGENVFDAAALPFLTNGNSLSFIVALDCLNGWFAIPTGYCLAESVVNEPGRGAIGCFASSGLGMLWEEQMVASELYRLLFAGGRPTLGALCTGSKVNAYKKGASSFVLTTFTLIGDPAMRLRGLP